MSSPGRNNINPPLTHIEIASNYNDSKRVIVYHSENWSGESSSYIPMTDEWTSVPSLTPGTCEIPL